MDYKHKAIYLILKEHFKDRHSDSFLLKASKKLIYFLSEKKSLIDDGGIDDFTYPKLTEVFDRDGNNWGCYNYELENGILSHELSYSDRNDVNSRCSLEILHIDDGWKYESTESTN